MASLSVTSLMQLLAVVAVSRVDRRRTTSSLLYWGLPDSPCNRQRTYSLESLVVQWTHIIYMGGKLWAKCKQDVRMYNAIYAIYVTYRRLRFERESFQELWVDTWVM